MEGSKIFTNTTQHDLNVKYFLSFQLQVVYNKRKCGMYCRITLLRHNLDENCINTGCLLCDGPL